MAEIGDHNYVGAVDELAGLMEEFRLSEAKLRRGDITVGFRRLTRTPAATIIESTTNHVDDSEYEPSPSMPEVSPVPKGIPVTSPMTGIFYNSPSPGSPLFVKEGEPVSAGQVIGLIEAMKVFNEIPCPISGIVLQILVQSGQIVNPGDTILLVGS